MVRASFLEVEDWTRRYQRNNKRTGLKNLRCFPICSDAHRLRGFCGRPAYVEVENPEGKPLRSWSAFVKLPKPGEEDAGVPVGKVMCKAEIVELTRTKVHQFRPWIAGEPFDDTLPADACIDEKVATFVYNKSRKGWHYSWVANKHTCDSEHVLRAYIFEALPNEKFKLLMSVDSPSFTIFCRRRQRQNLERLPPQLKEQLKLQDELKKTQGSALPRSITVGNATPGKKLVSVLTGKILEQPEKPAKRSTGVSNGPASKRQRKMDASLADSLMSSFPGLAPIYPMPTNSMQSEKTPAVRPTTYPEREILLYHVVRALMRLDIKSSTPLLNTVQSNDVFVLHPGDAEIPQVKLERSGFEDLSKSISDCLDCFTTHSSPMDYAASSSSMDVDGSDVSDTFSSCSRSQSGFDLPKLDDFEPLDIDFSVLDDADLTGLDTSANKKPQFGDIIREFAVCLIEETECTNNIEKALSALGEHATPSRVRQVTVSILLDNLQTFLSRFNISLDELYHLIKTQVWDTKKCNDGEEVTEKLSSQQQHDGETGTSFPPKSVRTAAIKSFMETVTHYTKTVNSMSPHSPRAAAGLLEIGLGSSNLWSTADPTMSPSDDTDQHPFPTAVHSSLSNPADSVESSTKSAFIPDNDDQNDFSGEWYRPHETLDILEGIRESMGVPWVMRKMLRYMETNLTLSHSEGCLESQSNRKLLSSGYQKYILDGCEHQWVLPPPIPTEKSNRKATYRATLKDGVLLLYLNYTNKKRLVRETRKSPDGNALESTVRFQFRSDPSEEWQDKLQAKCVAIRRVQDQSEDEFQFGGREQAQGDEFAWLSAPSDDFALTLS